MKLLVSGMVAAADKRHVHGWEKGGEQFEYERNLDYLVRPDCKSYT